MLLTNFIPTADCHTIDIPQQYFGKEISIEILDKSEEVHFKHKSKIEAIPETERLENIKIAFQFWDNNSRDLSQFKFNREQANER